MPLRVRSGLLSLCLGLFLVALPIAAVAHEGHDDAALAPTTDDPAIVVRAVANASMELVVKYRSTAAPAHLELYVSDFATNAPVTGAHIGLRTTAPAAIEASATEVRPGIYEAHLDYPSRGDYTLVITVAGPVSGEFALPALPLGSVPTPGGGTAPAAGGRPSFLVLALVGATFLSVALGLFRWRRARSRQGRARALALLMAVGWTLSSSDPFAHEGHDASPAGVAGAAGPRHVAKESQFLLGIRTVPLKLEQLHTQVTAVGHVVPGPGAWATIAAPQSGRFEGGRAWAVGDRVQRGQIVGHLQVIARLPVRAPISGLLAEVLVTPGQWVQAGQPLIRVLDPAQLRVEVPLFGENLSRGLAARVATVRLSALPDRILAARVRGLAPTAGTQFAEEGNPGPASSAASAIAPVLLDVTNTGGLLRPGMLVEVSFETAVSQAVFAVPASAIVYQETGAGVFVHTGAELFELRPVAVGARYVDRIGVSGSLEPGDRVVTQGAYSLIAAPAASAAPPGGAR